MTIYIVGHTKGGVGKTTTAVTLAAALAELRRDVMLINADRQNHAQVSIASRPEHLPPIACTHYPDGRELRQQVKLMTPKYDDIVIDVGGRDTSALRAALILADVVLVPFQPRSYEAWSLEEVAPLIDEAHSMRDGLQVYTFLNFADPGGLRAKDNAESLEVARAAPQFQLMASTLGRRKAFSIAAAKGISINDMRPRDEKACAEFNGLLAELGIFDRIPGVYTPAIHEVSA